MDFPVFQRQSTLFILKLKFSFVEEQSSSVHMIRNSLRNLFREYVSYKDYKAVTAELIPRRFETDLHVHHGRRSGAGTCSFRGKMGFQIWGYFCQSRNFVPQRKHWTAKLISHVIPLFDYPDEIRKAIYTTNAIESLNSVIRKTINNRKIFPDDNSVMKVVYLAVQKASKKWTMPIRDWKPALNRFMLERS
jgi:transposase-like protein